MRKNIERWKAVRSRVWVKYTIHSIVHRFIWHPSPWILKLAYAFWREWQKEEVNVKITSDAVSLWASSVVEAQEVWHEIIIVAWKFAPGEMWDEWYFFTTWRSCQVDLPKFNNLFRSRIFAPLYSSFNQSIDVGGTSFYYDYFILRASIHIMSFSPQT